VCDIAKSENNAFYRATRMHSADYAVATCLSICLSVRLSITRQYCAYTVTHILEVFSPSGSPTSLVFPHRTGWQYSDGNPPNGGVECKAVLKKSRFSINIKLYLGTDAR